MSTQSKTGLPIRRLLPLAVVILIMALVFSQGWHRYLSFALLVEHQATLEQFVSAHQLLALLAYAALYIAVVTLSLPGGALLSITGGFLFGLPIGSATTVVAATIGASVIFLIAKTSLGEPLAARAGPWLEKLRAGFKENALYYLLFLRLVPAFPFWLVNLAPAVLGVPLRTYVVGTAIGIIPGTFAFTFLGVGLQSIIEQERQAHATCLASQPASECAFAFSPADLITAELLLAFTALGVVALIPVAVRKWRKS